MKRQVMSKSIKLIPCSTKLVLKFEVRAFGDKVVFNQQEQTVTISGDAKLWRGKDEVRGQRIIYNLKTGWIKAEQVAGVVQPQPEEGK